MAKFVQPTFDVYGIAEFKNKVQFDSSVYLQGVTHISNPGITSSTTPYALVVNSIGSDVSIQSIQLGTMATETASNYYTSSGTDGAIATAVGNVDSSLVTYIGTQVGNVDSSLVSYVDGYNVIQDGSISRNTEKWTDSNRNGLLNQTETTLAFVDTTGVFTLGDSGSGWSYYLNGQKYSFTGPTSITLPGGGSAAANRYYIYINNNTDASLAVSTSVWDREAGQLPVAFIDFDASNAFSKYWMGEERHTMLIDTRMHKYLHNTRGTQFISGGTLDGPVVAGPGGIGATDASNAFGVAATTIADEDIYQLLGAFAKPANPTGTPGLYNVFSRTAPTVWTWISEDTPLPEAGSYIQYDNGSGLSTATPGNYVNTYLMFTNLNGKARYSIIPGQGEFTTLAGAIDENFAAFDLTGLPIAEYVAAWQFTWEASAGLTTRGKVSLASTPVRIQVNSATASTPTTEAHNDLLGLQGGSATQRYHLDLAQYNDYIGKTDVDSSLLTVWNKLGYVDSSVSNLDLLTQRHTTDISDVSTRVNVVEPIVTRHTTDISDVSTRVNVVEPIVTRHTTDISDVSTRVNVVEPIVTRHTTDISDVSTRVQTNEGDITQLGTDVGDVSTRVQTLEGNVGDYVLKSGDTMSGPLTISGGGLSVANDVSISGGLLVSGSNGLIVTNDAFIGGSLTIDGSLYVTNVETIDVSAAYIHLNTGLTGTPPPTMQSGLVIGRGSEEPYVFLFDETLDTFRIGIATETSTGYLDPSTQAVATREDSPQSWGVGYWNGTEFQIETSAGFTFTPGTGLSLPIADGQGTQYTVLSINDSSLVGSVELGTMAFASVANFALATDVADVSTRVNVVEPIVTRHTTDISDVSTRVNVVEPIVTRHTTDISDVSTRVNVVEPIVTRHTSDISDVSTRVQTNEADIAQLDASIIRIDASLNDVIDILDLGFVTETSIGLFKTNYIDPSLNAKLNLTGGTLSGLLTLASAGVTLDSVNIKTIDTSAEGLSDSSTSLATSAAISKAISQAIAAGVTADNGLTENPAGNIQLGGPLTKPTTITATDASALKFAGITNVAGEQTIYAESSLGNLITTEVGTMAFETASIWDSSLSDIRLDITQLGTDIGDVSTRVNVVEPIVTRHTSDISDVSTRVNVVEPIVTRHTSDISDVSTRVNVVEPIVTRHTTDISDVSTRVQTLENSSVDAWNGLTTSVDGSIGLGGALDRDTSIDTTGYTLSFRGLQTSLIDTPLALVQDSADSSLLVRQLGTMAWETATDFALATDVADVSTRVNVVEPIVTRHTTDISDVSTRVNVIEPIVTRHTTDISDVSTRVNVVEPIVTRHTSDISDVSTRVQTNEGDITQLGTDVGDVSTRVQTLEGNVGDYVLKTGDTMSGDLTTTGLVVSNDVSISGSVLISTDLIVTGDTTVGGSLTVDGSLYVVNVETIDVSAAFIHLNTGLTGVPPATLQSGLVVGRGSSDPYVFLFDETLDTFRIGAAVETSTGYLDVDTQAVATREDVPTAWGVGYWNGTEFQIETSVGFTFQPGVGLKIPGVTGSGSEQTALFITDASLVVARELGDMAFASVANFALATDVADVSTRLNVVEPIVTRHTTDISDVSTRVQTNEGDITQLGTDIGDVSTRVNVVEPIVTRHTTDISDVSTRVQTNEGDITQIGTDIGDVSTRVNVVEPIVTRHTTDISDVSTRVQTIETDFIDSVADTTGVVGGTGLYAGEANNTAYIKQLVGGTGATITSDSSTVTISVTSAEGYSEKWSGSFSADGSTSFVFDPSSISGTGPYGVTVWEANEVVQVGVTNNPAGTITLSWIPESLVGICDVLVIG